MRIKANLTIDAAMRASERRGQNTFPQGTVTVSYDPSTEERSLPTLTAVLRGDGESWTLNGELLGKRFQRFMQGQNFVLFTPLDLYESLGVAVAVLQENGARLHRAWSAVEDDAFRGMDSLPWFHDVVNETLTGA